MMKYYITLVVCVLLALSHSVFAEVEDDDTFNLKAIKSMHLKSLPENSRRNLRSLRGLKNDPVDDDYLFGEDDDYITRDDDNFGDDQNDDDILSDAYDLAQMDDDFWGDK